MPDAASCGAVRICDKTAPPASCDAAENVREKLYKNVQYYLTNGKYFVIIKQN